MRNIKLVIPGELMTLNQYVNKQRTNRFVANGAKQKFTNIVKNEVLRNKKENPKFKIPFPSKLKIIWYRKNKRSDPDNIAFAKKFILDGIMKAGELDNDNWTNVLGFEDHFRIDKDNPRTEVEFVEPEKEEVK